MAGARRGRHDSMFEYPWPFVCRPEPAYEYFLAPILASIGGTDIWDDRRDASRSKAVNSFNTVLNLCAN
jgi:hypothetical protein